MLLTKMGVIVTFFPRITMPWSPWRTIYFAPPMNRPFCGSTLFSSNPFTMLATSVALSCTVLIHFQYIQTKSLPYTTYLSRKVQKADSRDAWDSFTEKFDYKCKHYDTIRITDHLYKQPKQEFLMAGQELNDKRPRSDGDNVHVDITSALARNISN